MRCVGPTPIRGLATHDKAIAGLITAIRELASPAQPPPRRRIGVVTDE